MAAGSRYLCKYYTASPTECRTACEHTHATVVAGALETLESEARVPPASDLSAVTAQHLRVCMQAKFVAGVLEALVSEGPKVALEMANCSVGAAGDVSGPCPIVCSLIVERMA